MLKRAIPRRTTVAAHHDDRVGIDVGIRARAAAADHDLSGTGGHAENSTEVVAAGKCRPTDTANTLADGLAVRVPSDLALSIILDNVSRVVAVSEKALLDAVQYLFTDTHNVVEGAGAATLAAVLNESAANAGKKVAAIISGGNIDRALFIEALSTD